MKTLIKLFPFAAILALFAACSISGDVACVPLPMRSKISEVYIANAESARNEAFEKELIKHLDVMGFRAEVTAPGVAPDDGYILKYEVRYGKSLKTLDFIRLEVSHDKRVVGYINSDASDCAEKYGTTAERLSPVVDRLFQFAQPAPDEVEKK
jgi:hypothetical protein